MRDRILAHLAIAISLPQQEVRECRIAVCTSEIKTCSATVAIFRLLHPHRSKPGADGVISMLDGKIVKHVLVDVSLIAGRASDASTGEPPNADVRCASVWVLVSRIVGELSVERRLICNATEVRVDCSPGIPQLNL